MSYTAEVLADSPTAYWRFNETSGTTAADSSGNGRSGTHTGAVTVAEPGPLTGQSSSAVLYAGGRTIVPASVINGGTSVTVEFWCKRTTTGDGVAAFQWVGSGSQRAAASNLPWSNNIIFWDAGNNPYDRISKTVDFTTTTWHHYAFIKDVAAGVMSIYIDGALWDTAGSLSQPLGTATSASIGADPAGTSPMNGYVAEFAVYPSALSAGRIAAHYAAASATSGPATIPFAFTGAAQSHTFDEAGSATVTLNGAGNGTDKGGQSVLTIPVDVGDVWQVNVGGKPNGTTGGWNGGGGGGARGTTGGAGGTDIRINGTTLADRACVAGGAGGGYGGYATGVGGGVAGGTSQWPGGGGTQSAGGAGYAGEPTGTQSSGGSNSSTDTAGGGGGYWGGGSGYGGGGGSGYLAPSVPAGATSGGTTTQGAGNTGNGNATIVFTPAAAPVPTVTAVSPTSGTTAGATTVTLTGTNLTAATAVAFGTTAATGLTGNTSTSLTVTSPARAVGTVDITVTTSGGTSTTSSADQYTYIAPASAPTFTADTPPTTGTVGASYGPYTFAATGGPTFAVASGALPNGLSLNGSTGVLSGTPTTVGSSTFTVSATNGGGADTTDSITIVIVAAPLFTADTPPTTGTVGASYGPYTFTASGYPAPSFAVASGALPDGLNLNTTTGVLDGAPTVAGSYTFTFSASNGTAPDAVTSAITVVIAQPARTYVSTTRSNARTAVSIYSTAPDGTGGVYLDSLGQTGAWQHTLNYPGGDSSATFTFNADPQLHHPALTAGRILHARAGSATVFTGRLDQPDRSTMPWSMSVVGLAALAKDHVIAGPYGTDLDAVVDAAITNGLPWTRPANLTSPTTSIAQSSTVDEALGLLATDRQPWTLTATGALSTPTAPTVPTLALWVPDLPGRTLASYANVAVVVYTNSSNVVTVVTVTGSAAELDARGRIETPLDLTDSYYTTSPAAAAAGTKYLTSLMQPTWQSAFVGASNTVTTLAGVPVDPATVRPGQIMRVFALHPDDIGAASTDVLIGQVVYDNVTGTIACLPVAAVPVDFTSTIARALT